MLPRVEDVLHGVIYWRLAHALEREKICVMVAKIVGVGLVFWGAVLAFALIVPVLGSLFAAAVLAVTGFLAAGLLYVGLRWLRGESTLGKVLGVLCILVGIAIGIEALSSAVVGLFGVLLLAVKIFVVCAMCYVGWSWFQQGTFSLPHRRI